MAISAKMLAVLQKVDAERAAFFEGLRESAEQEAREATKKKQAAAAKKTPPITQPPLRVTSTGGARHKPHKDRSTHLPRP